MLKPNKTDFEINDLGSVGLIKDAPDYMQVPEAFSHMFNVRVLDGGHIATIGGRQAIFGAPPQPPHFAINVVGATQNWFLWTGLDRAWVWDGLTHTEITRLSGFYTTGETKDWNATILGGIPILNNGNDAPQAWLAYTTGTRLVDLPNWPANVRAKVIRAFGSYLVAINITKPGGNFPHMVKWSHPAEVGNVPLSWDETDPSVDAGETELPDGESGRLVNALQLRGQMFLYKEGAIWRMRKIGGRLIFAFDSFVETNGLVAPRAVCTTSDGGAHVCVFQDDVVVHDGQNVRPLLTGKFRRQLFRQLDAEAARHTFCFSHPEFGEIWICYAENGQKKPSRALILKENSWTVTEAAVNFRNACWGPVIATAGSPTGVAWDTVSSAWDTFTPTWDSAQEGADRRRVILCATDAAKFMQLDKGERFDGSPFTSTIRREGLSLIGRKRSGEPIVDFKQRKMYTRVWIKGFGQPFNVRMGYRERPNDVTVWLPAQEFDPGPGKGADLWRDFVMEGRAVAIEFEGVQGEYFEVHGYKIELSLTGNF